MSPRSMYAEQDKEVNPLDVGSRDEVSGPSCMLCFGRAKEEPMGCSSGWRFTQHQTRSGRSIRCLGPALSLDEYKGE